MVDGERLGDVGFKYLGTPYSVMDCQAFVEKCLSDCGCNKNLAGSNAWYREVMQNGAVMTPEECVKELGCVPKGAFLFILEQDGGEPSKYKGDGIGNASHIGIVTMPRGEGAIHSSASKGCVCESVFKGKTIKNGGWNRVGLWDKVSYDYGGGGVPAPEPPPVWHTTIRRGSKGDEVALCQSILAQLGYDLGSAGIDGDFGRKTEDAVRAFQQANGLYPDGVVGPLTWSMLENAVPAPATTFYTVTIKHLTEYQAEALKERFDGAVIIKEE